MRFKDYLTEKLKPSQFRNIVQKWKASGVSKKFDKVFGKKDRIYETYEGERDFEPRNQEATLAMKNLIKHYNDLTREHYTLVSYFKGIVKNTKGREMKLGKFLTNFIDQVEKDKISTVKYKNDLLKSLKLMYGDFVNDKDRALAKYKGELLICYSRHAYDVAGMSTDRGWTSCMTLPGDKKQPEGGVQKNYVPIEAKEGTLIAYLIKDDDKNVEHPLGRILIKPYYSEGKKHLLMVACTDGKGTVPQDMIKQVNKWTEKLNKDIPFTEYVLATGLDTSDIDYTRIAKTPDNLEDLKNVTKIEDTKRLVIFYRHFDLSGTWEKNHHFMYRYANNQYYFFDMKKIIDTFDLGDFLPLFKKDTDEAHMALFKIIKLRDNGYDVRKVMMGMDIINLVHAFDFLLDTRSKEAFEKSYLTKYKNKDFYSDKYKDMYDDFIEVLKKYYTKILKIYANKGIV